MYHIRDYLRKKYQIKVEPYWNVNIIEVKSNLNYTNIKVEPYWNVNVPYKRLFKEKISD